MRGQLGISLEDNTEVPKFVLKQALRVEHNAKMVSIMKKANISKDVWPISRGGKTFTLTRSMIQKIAPFI